MANTSSPYNPNRRKDVAAAADMLQRLLPLAETAADRNGAPTEFSMSGVAAAAFPYWHVANVSGVHIYQTERGWFGDVILRNVPDGVSNVCGTPSHLPHKTRFLAEDGTVRILELMVLNDRGLVTPTGAESPPPDHITFDIDHVTVGIPLRAIEIVKDAIEQFGLDPGTGADLSEAMLMKLLTEDFGDGETTQEGLEAMSSERRQLYFTHMTTLLAARGQFRFWREELAIEDYEEHADKAWTARMKLKT